MKWTCFAALDHLPPHRLKLAKPDAVFLPPRVSCPEPVPPWLTHPLFRPAPKCLRSCVPNTRCPLSLTSPSSGSPAQRPYRSLSRKLLSELSAVSIAHLRPAPPACAQITCARLCSKPPTPTKLPRTLRCSPMPLSRETLLRLSPRTLLALPCTRSPKSSGTFGPLQWGRFLGVLWASFFAMPSVKRRVIAFGLCKSASALLRGEAAVHASGLGGTLRHLTGCSSKSTSATRSILSVGNPSSPEAVNTCRLYSQASHLRFGERVMPSTTGVQQGDPLGPLLFALALQPALRAAAAHPVDLCFSYLDDVVIAGSARRNTLRTRSGILSLRLGARGCISSPAKVSSSSTLLRRHMLTCCCSPPAYPWWSPTPLSFWELPLAPTHSASTTVRKLWRKLLNAWGPLCGPPPLPG